MSKSQVSKVRVPACRAVDVLGRIDYADAYGMALPPGEARSIDALVRVAVTSAPAWVEVAMRVRNAIMRPFGVRTNAGRAFPAAASRDAPLVVGDRVGLFRVYERTAGEVLLGEDDRHLDFRVSVLRDGDTMTFVTAVRFNNWLGRAYFVPVRVGHRLVVPAMMRVAMGRLKEPS